MFCLCCAVSNAWQTNVAATSITFGWLTIYCKSFFLQLADKRANCILIAGYDLGIYMFVWKHRTDVTMYAV